MRAPVSLSLCLALTLAYGCSGSTKDTSTGSDSTADTDTNSVDSNMGGDSAGPTGTVDGTVVAYDGPVSNISVQACVTQCYTTRTDATGAFHFTGMRAGNYKIDAIGFGTTDHGDERVPATLADDASAWTAPSPMFLPQLFGPVVMTTSKTYTFGPIAWTVDPSTLTVDPLAGDANTLWAGVVPASGIGAFWGVTPSLAVAFGPLGTVATGTFTMAITSDIAAGDYDVYSVDAIGQIGAPVGSATADGTTVNLTATPPYLTWLLIAPKT